MAKTSSKTSASGDEKAGATFESALARLEEIVELLDDGNLPLAQSLALFREGATLTKRCRALLADAELQIKEALRDVREDGDLAADISGEADAEDEEEEEDEDREV